MQVNVYNLVPPSIDRCLFYHRITVQQGTLFHQKDINFSTNGDPLSVDEFRVAWRKSGEYLYRSM